MRKYSQDCPIARTLDVVGDRWTLLILRDMFMGSSKFGEFRERSSIPPKVLSARLKLLMEDGVVEREVYSDHPLRAEYHLTERGRSLLPVVLAVGMWGLDHEFEGESELRNAVAGYIYKSIPESRESLEEAGYVVRRAGTD
jgi:DNA-binding HxlR family transcriptional regulator